MGGSGTEDWSTAMFAAAAETAERTANYSSFIASGEQHCILPFDNFYSVEAEGRRLVDFIGAQLSREPVERVACTACDEPTP